MGGRQKIMPSATTSRPRKPRTRVSNAAGARPLGGSFGPIVGCSPSELGHVSVAGSSWCPEFFHQDHACDMRLTCDRAIQKQANEMRAAAGVIQGRVLDSNAFVRS